MAARLRARSPTSSSAAASAWPATWPSSPSSAAPARPTAPRSKSILRDRILQIQESGELDYVNVNELKGIDRQFLVERQLISREHAESEGARGVAIDRREQVSLMINEEDHLRIQVMHSGLDLQARLGADQPHRRR